MVYELWDTRSGNHVDWFPTEQEALTFVRMTLAEPESGALVAEWLLDQVTDDGRGRVVARGSELRRRASGGDAV